MKKFNRTVPQEVIQAQTGPSDPAEMVFVPAGEFIRGSLDGPDDERPQRLIQLDAFWISKYPVTVAQYSKFCRQTRHQMPPALSWGWHADHPIVNVSWHDADAYCTYAGVRLPTEAEWEKAARGTDGREYPWGNDWDDNRCAKRTHDWGAASTDLKSPVPVETYPSGASPFGVCHMAGNVWEWCMDWYDAKYYHTAPDRNPTGPNAGEERVVRGGAWDFLDRSYFRAARRSKVKPSGRSYNLGFRCAKAGS